MTRICLAVLFATPGLLALPEASAQDTLREYYYWDDDSIFYSRIIRLNPFVLFESRSGDYKERVALKQMQYYINTVYPYYVRAMRLKYEVDRDLESIKKRRHQRKYIRQKHRTLKVDFKDQLKELSINQGRTLIKLIERSSGMSFYDFIRKYKGALEAAKWELMAGFYTDYSLREGYDPLKEKYMEIVIRAMEE